MMNTKDHLLSSYDFDLPEERIAQHPPEVRGMSRLLVMDRNTGRVEDHFFKDIHTLIPEDALLVANNSKVLPARMFGHKKSGGRVEVLPLTPLPLIEEAKKLVDSGFESRAECLLKASKSPKIGARIIIADDLECVVVDKGDFGRHIVDLKWSGDLKELIRAHGHMPLPPYIKRNDELEDQDRYQTTYSKEEKTGSVAAPTAGLHFTPEIRDRLTESGCSWAEVTLYVGYGTFSPVRCEDIREHSMHKEYVEVPQSTATALLKAKEQGRPIVAVGTTSARTLEGMFRECGEIRAFKGETDIFITPGYRFQVLDHLITNFHLPKSSLVMMVAALVGREQILAAYKYAVENEYRFFSYGDAMLIR